MELKKNQIVIFRNKKKSSEKQPDYKGLIEIDGEKHEVSLWVRESKASGEKYFSGEHKVVSQNWDRVEKKDQLSPEPSDLPF